MKPAVEKLYKVFKLEAARGFDDGAMVGGLQKLFATWENEARADDLDEPLIRAVGERLRAYARMDQKSRSAALFGLWRRIGSSVGETLPPLDSAGRPAANRPPRVERPAAADAPARAPRPEKAAREGARAPRPDAPRPAQRPPRPPRSAPAAGDAGEEQDDYRFPDAPPVLPGEMTALSAPLTVLSGVGDKYARSLARLGLSTLQDALYYFPRRYDDYSELKPINRLWYGEEVTIIGLVQQVSIRQAGKFKIVEALVNDGSGAIRATWFNQPWIAEKLANSQVVLSGKVGQFLGRLQMENPEWEPLERQTLHTNRIVPVYPINADITQRWLRRTLHQIVGYWALRVPDPIPASIRNAAGLLPLGIALQQVHFPDSQKRLAQARERLAFDEVFLLQLGMLRQRHAVKTREARVFTAPENWLADRLTQLPFALTGAQRRAVADVAGDLASGQPMNRLLQGDVGAGKTIVAALSVEMVAQAGAQAVLMAPTSILAEQHYQGLLRVLAAPGGVFQPEEIRLLIGATPAAEKEDILAGLASGAVRLVIGTHAVIEERVVFQDLQLIVIDEQHRFGVQQRGRLREKGQNVHLLVMTATPIPRSLALSMFGDLDISVLDEMPPGRQEIATHLLSGLERERAYRLVRREVTAGRQAFMIFPLVEESEKTEAKAAVEEYDRLQKEIFPDLRLGLLHGRLKPEEKEAVMQRFRAGEDHVLVSTSVVEVGVDVPNATVMIIDGANRFGLAQLHQFRGRVGRGAHKSYCLLISDKSAEQENERLQAMVETNDGFKLAEKDLQQRGPGEFLGVRQAGFASFKMASLTDVRLIEKARQFAQELFQEDPLFANSEHASLWEAVEQFWQAGKSDVS